MYKPGNNKRTWPLAGWLLCKDLEPTRASTESTLQNLFQVASCSLSDRSSQVWAQDSWRRRPAPANYQIGHNQSAGARPLWAPLFQSPEHNTNTISHHRVACNCLTPNTDYSILSIVLDSSRLASRTMQSLFCLIQWSTSIGWLENSAAKPTLCNNNGAGRPDPTPVNHFSFFRAAPP